MAPERTRRRTEAARTAETSVTFVQHAISRSKALHSKPPERVSCFSRTSTLNSYQNTIVHRKRKTRNHPMYLNRDSYTFCFFLSSMSNCALGRVGYIMEHPSHPPPLLPARHESFSSCVPSPPASFQAVTAAWAEFLVAKARQDQIRPRRLAMPLAQAAADPSSANVI